MQTRRLTAGHYRGGAPRRPKLAAAVRHLAQSVGRNGRQLNTQRLGSDGVERRGLASPWEQRHNAVCKQLKKT
ncbi:hypothetical protein E2C01_034356 [Portunus trituberculatus]|uniref:Uncharacterized protein n=1 Tax=Portunus trituberculatus TaxID=210409 RepID=A0A5B7F6F3_PORTR|nr:hypothetical protein [Portunus trituberculatus]